MARALLSAAFVVQRGSEMAQSMLQKLCHSDAERSGGGGTCFLGDDEPRPV